MIDEEATFKKFGYYPSALKPYSNKPILAACDACGKAREIRKNAYHALCGSCATKGRIFTEEWKARIGAAQKGRKNHNYKDGNKNARKRSQAKRKRQLGYTLLMPLKEGEEGHHVTDEYVIGIPAKIHHNFNSNSRKKHRTRVLQWLKVNDKKKYKRVLCVLAKQLL